MHFIISKQVICSLVQVIFICLSNSILWHISHGYPLMMGTQWAHVFFSLKCTDNILCVAADVLPTYFVVSLTVY